VFYITLLRIISTRAITVLAGTRMLGVCCLRNNSRCLHEPESQRQALSLAERSAKLIFGLPDKSGRRIVSRQAVLQSQEGL
jgi:hypothetical protein